MHLGLGIGEGVERDQGVGEGLPQRGFRRDVREAPPHSVDLHVELAPRDRGLAGEVAEERAAGDVGGLGDLVDARRLVAVAREEVEGHAHDRRVRRGGATPRDPPLGRLHDSHDTERRARGHCYWHQVPI